MITEYAIE